MHLPVGVIRITLAPDVSALTQFAVPHIRFRSLSHAVSGDRIVRTKDFSGGTKCAARSAHYFSQGSPRVSINRNNSKIKRKDHDSKT